MLELVHSDLCGPISSEGYNQHKYIHTLVDDYSRFTMIRTLSKKDHIADAVLDMIQAMKIIADERKIKYIQTDHGGEYRSKEFLKELSRKGT